MSRALWVLGVVGLLLGGCRAEVPGNDAGTAPGDASTDAGTEPDDGGTDAGDDPGDGGVITVAPCERTAGVCAGAQRAWVDGGYEPVCTAASYGADFEAEETRCDGLNNDCDGVTDPQWSSVTTLGHDVFDGKVSMLSVEDGVLVALLDDTRNTRLLKLDRALQRVHEARWVRPTADWVSFTYSSRVQLLRTAHGPVLHLLEGRRTPVPGTFGELYALEEDGAPVALPDGGVAGVEVLQSAQLETRGVAGTSPDGERVLSVYGAVPSAANRCPELLGTVSGAAGGVLVEPRPLFQLAPEVNNRCLLAADVLGLPDGGFVVAVKDAPWHLDAPATEVVRLRHFDAQLQPVGEERILGSSFYFKTLELVDLGEGAGADPLERVALLLATDHTIELIRAPLRQGVSEVLVQFPYDESPWLGARVGTEGLQLAWVNELVYRPFGFPPFASYGRVWSLGAGQEQVGPTRHSGDRIFSNQATGLHLEQLAPRTWAAFVVTRELEGPWELSGVRFCAR